MRDIFKTSCRSIVSVALLGASAMFCRASDPGIELFEKSIRPLLVDHCYACHSVESGKSKGSLLLDSRASVLKGGDSGPAIVPGDPEKSLLIKAVRYADENLQMPPKGKQLPKEKVALLEDWVKIGAPDPRTGTNAAGSSVDAARRHWSFQPVRLPAVPAVKNAKAVESPIDSFLLQKLEAKGLHFSAEADKRSLIRRATYDLHGLPPTAEEVDAFIADKSSDAFGRLIDRLLASPRYGERWGRYWLDVARYADTKGYVFEEERRYPFAYTYRDYVIRAFNEDLPYNRFVVEQIAGDAVSTGEDKRAMAGLGFLTLGRRFLNNQPDIIDDRIDVVSRGFMGLTVSCARCHDHKYDPISTKDYYSLYGIFASSEEPSDKPLLGKESLPKEYPAYLAERKKREAELDKFVTEKRSEMLSKVRGQVGDYLLVVHDAAEAKKSGKEEGLVRQRKLSPALARRWEEYLEGKNTNDPIFGPWLQLAALPETNFASFAKELSKTFAPSSNRGEINPLIAQLFTNAPSSLKEAASRYTAVFAEINKQGASTAPTNDAKAGPLRYVLFADKSPFALEPNEFRRLFDTPAQQRERALKRKIDELDATHAGAPPRAMAMVDRATPVEPVVFVRGNPGNRGPKVPRQFLEVLSAPDRQPFTNGSGRLEFAQAIANTNNPLTARVLVNRVWMYHFGSPLVRTPSDFGVRAEPPTHPELLDYVAARFMTEGWSVKRLHRLIMLSAAYRQGSEDNPRGVKTDPANELLWRMNRRRLDFEALRDTLLAAGGRLDFAQGGHPVDITKQPFPTRRTVYSFIERQNLPGIFRTFDFASPDTSSAQRFATTVPQQALFLMNSPFVVEQAKYLAERPELKGAADDTRRVEALYRIALQRMPDREETHAATAYVKSQAKATNAPVQKLWQYGFGEYDETSKKVKTFKALAHFTGSAWQGGSKLPDDKLGWVMLNAEGGHVGNDLAHAAVRRWTAPSDGTVDVRSTLVHASKEGDGVRGRIVSSRHGLLGEWTAHNSEAAAKVARIAVRPGDTIDFVADMRGGYGFDSFVWAPVIRYAEMAGGAGRTCSAREEFAGPEPKVEPLSPWAKYAQVMLLANEMAFVD